MTHGRRRRPRPAGAARRAAPGRGDRSRAAGGHLARRPARRSAGEGGRCWCSTRSPIRIMSARSCAPPRRSARSASSPRTAIRRPKAASLAKAASGALERVPWARVVNLARALEEIAEAGFWRIGLAGEATTELKDALGPAAGRAGARRRRAGHAAQHARALRRAGAAADHRRGRKPQRLQRGRGRALRGERRLMVRTTESLNASLDALAEREKAFAKVLETHGRPEPRPASRASRRCCGPSSASRSASPRRDRCGTSSTAKFGQPVDLDSAARCERRRAARGRPVAAEGGLCAQPRRAGAVGRARPRPSARRTTRKRSRC